MSTRILPPTFTAALLKALQPSQFVTVTLVYGMESIARRIVGEGVDDLPGWEVIMEKIRALPPSPIDKMTWSEIQAYKRERQ
jgi:hypothetical protein